MGALQIQILAFFDITNCYIKHQWQTLVCWSWNDLYNFNYIIINMVHCLAGMWWLKWFM